MNYDYKGAKNKNLTVDLSNFTTESQELRKISVYGTFDELVGGQFIQRELGLIFWFTPN